MIIVKTKLKKIPESCAKCKFSYAEGWCYEPSRKCILTDAKVPYEYIKERKNWCYTKCENCPLEEV